MSGTRPAHLPASQPVVAEPGDVVNLVAIAAGLTIALVAMGSAYKENE